MGLLIHGLCTVIGAGFGLGYGLLFGASGYALLNCIIGFAIGSCVSSIVIGMFFAAKENA